MKKVLSIAVSVLMLLTCMLPAFAAEKTVTPASEKAEYDVAAVAGGDVASLDYEQIAGVLLDWLDRRIADAAADFNAFTASVGVDLSITGVDSLVGMKDHLAELGGDFANLDTDAIVTREGGDVNFLFGIFQFMADNAETLGKVFRWDDQVFDYGKVGEYIMGLEDGDPIKTFYVDYLVNGDIQDKFIREIAREMDYEVPETRTETFDEIISNGVKAKFLEIFGGLLSEESKAAVNAMDLRTTDVYALVKEFFGLLQNDYKGDFDAALSGFMTALQGMVNVIKEAVNLEPPTASIGDANGVLRTYHPADADPESYMPTVYVNEQYKALLEGALPADSPVTVSAEALPEDAAALIAGNGTEMADSFVMTVKQGEETLANINLPFGEIEAFAKQTATELANSMAAGMGATVKDVDVAFGYTAYTAEGIYVMQVSVTKAAVSAEMTFNGITVPVNNIDVSSAVPSPVATVVVRNLDGEIEDLAQVKKLADAIDTEAAYDYDLLDVMANYDDYKGVVGQANRILCEALDMLLTDEAYADLGLTEGGNENLTANLEKLCAKADGMLDMMKKYIDRDTFIALANELNIGSGFASSHGFNAGMIYDMDFSSVENALVCGIRVACDLLVEDDPDSILYDFHMRVEDLETLDAMAAATVDMILGRVMKAVDLEGFNYTYTPIDYANVAEDGAENAIMDKVVDILYYTATYAADKVNGVANGLIEDLNADLGLGIGQVNFKLGVEKNRSWSVTLSGLTDRFLQLSNGAFIAAGNLDGMKDLWGRLNGIVNALLPMNTFFSNYESLTASRTALYDEALDGDFVNLLSLFEVKEDDIAAGVPVTKALINVSDYMVDAFFPDTVEAQLYDEGLTVQEIFTGSESDQGIAARNMVSLNNRKAHLLPALLDLVRESGVLPSLACDHETKEPVAAKAATCTEKGNTAGERCTVCGMTFGVEEIPVDPANHTALEAIPAKAATCTKPGATAGEKCAACGVTTKAPEEIAPTGHNYENGVCTVCGAEEPAAPDEGDNGGEKTGFAAFWQRIVDFFQKIVNFFKGLFNR